MDFLVINGPNLNRLEQREARYGSISFDDYLETLRERYPEHGLYYIQSNHEGRLIDALQDAPLHYNGAVLNAGGLTHSSIGLRDAIALVDIPVVEVHITDILSREPFRQVSYLSEPCIGTISGFGLQSYDLGIRALIHYSSPNE